MADAWAVAAAALGASALTIVGSFWLERWRGRQAARTSRHEQLRAACGQLNSHAISLALRSNALYLTTVLRSGIGEGFDVVLYHRKPVDPLELTGWLLPDWEAIAQAQMTIELFGDEDLIRSAADVVLRAMAVLEASTNAFQRADDPARPRWRRAVRHVYSNLVPLRRSDAVERAIQERIREMGRSLRQFASLTRKRLGVNDPDAVIRAFPELFADEQPTAGPETADLAGRPG